MNAIEHFMCTWTSLGDAVIVDYLLEAGANANSTDVWGNTPLYLTAKDGISSIYVKHDQVNLKINFFF